MHKLERPSFPEVNWKSAQAIWRSFRMPVADADEEIMDLHRSDIYATLRSPLLRWNSFNESRTPRLPLPAYFCILPVSAVVATNVRSHANPDRASCCPDAGKSFLRSHARVSQAR